MTEISLRDEPIERPDEGRLGLKVYADVLHDYLLRSDTPVALGIQGESGSGKTSLLNLIKWNLDHSGGGGSETPYVSFNPWQFALMNDEGPTGADLIRGMIRRVQELPQRFEESQGQREFDRGLDEESSDARPDTLSHGLPAVVPQSETPFEGMPAVEDFSGDLEKFRDDFRSLVKDVNKEVGANRIVVFVDDLDRLDPERAFVLLENLATFLKVPGCCYVMSVSYDVVQAGMREKFGEELHRQKGKAFYDKVVDVPFNMPTDTYELGTFITDLLNESGFITYQVAPEEQSFYETVTSHSVGRNPRNIKRVIKKAKLIDKMRSEVKKKLGEQQSMRDKRMLYALTCMQIAWPELFNFLADHKQVDTLKNFDVEKFLAKRREGRQLLDRVDDERRLIRDMQTYTETIVDRSDSAMSADIEPLLRMIKFA